MDVTVILGKSESGDDYGPWVFYNRPTDYQLEKFLREIAPDEFVDGQVGPGEFGSYLHIEINDLSIIEISLYQ